MVNDFVWFELQKYTQTLAVIFKVRRVSRRCTEERSTCRKTLDRNWNRVNLKFFAVFLVRRILTTASRWHCDRDASFNLKGEVVTRFSFHVPSTDCSKFRLSVVLRPVCQIWQLLVVKMCIAKKKMLVLT